MGQQEAAGETEEAETATGAVTCWWPDGRSIGPPHLHLWRHHGWRIELLFKRAKGLTGWSFTHGRSGDRVVAELLAKVLGLVVLHWATLLSGPALTEVSATALMRRAAESAKAIGRALAKGGDGLVEELCQMLQELDRLRPRPKRRRKPNTLDLLANPELAAPAA